MSFFIRNLKAMVPGWAKGYRFLRYARIVLTPVVSVWHSLFTNGQLRSLLAAKPVNAKGEAIPWFSYAAIQFLEQQNLDGLRVFEFGTGNSTLYWARKGCRVRGVEYDESWAAYVASTIPAGSEVVHRADLDEYANAISEYEGDFDIIVVDGAVRGKCAENAAGRLAPGGFLILDNSEAYSGVAGALREKGLLQVDFIGPAPLVSSWQATSIFFQRDHVFRGEVAPRVVEGMTVYPKEWRPQ